MRYLAFTFCFLLARCEQTRTDDTLVGAYADILLYRQSSTTADSTKLRGGIDSLLAVHGLTRTEFEDHLAAYADRPVDFRRFNELVQERIASARKP